MTPTKKLVPTVKSTPINQREILYNSVVTSAMMIKRLECFFPTHIQRKTTWKIFLSPYMI